jgi:hypothetical protein
MAGQRIQSLTEPIAVFCQGNVLLHGGADPKELVYLIEGSAEARCRGNASEPAHGVGALFDATVILLESSDERAVGPVEHVTAQGLTDRTRAGVMPIGRHPLWGVTHHIECLRRSNRLATSMSRVSLEPRINQIAIAIDAQEREHHVPLTLMEVSSTDQDRASLLGKQLIGHEWGKTGLRVSNGLVREHTAALQAQLGEIPQAQLIPESPEHDELDDIGGIVQEVERGPRAFVEGSSAV